MEKKFYPLLSTAVALLLGGCAAPTEPAPTRAAAASLFETMNVIARDLQSSGALAAVGIGESKSAYLALNYAKRNGRLEMARQLDAKMNALLEAFLEELGEDEEGRQTQWFDDTSRLIVERMISVLDAVEIQQESVGDSVRMLVLMELSPKLIAEQLAGRQELYARFRATKAFEKLHAEIQGFEALKAESSPAP